MHIEMNKVCVPIDFSETSEHALLYGGTFAERFGAQLHLLHVVQDLDAFMTEPTGLASWPSAEILQDIEQGASKSLEKLSESVPKSVDVVRVLKHGVPFHEITRYAEKEKVDLLIIGTHGRTGLKHFLLGSVAERVVRSSPCPVLTIRHPEHEFVVPDHGAS